MPSTTHAAIDAEISNAKKIARQRVEAVWAFLAVVRPYLAVDDRKKLALSVLELCRGEYKPPSLPRVEIAPSQVEEIIWANMQCIHPRCPMLLFSKQIAEELNAFFNLKE